MNFKYQSILPRIILAPLTALLLITPVHAEEFTDEYMSNPFDPVSEGADASDASSVDINQVTAGVHPLIQSHVKSYTLLAVISSPNWSVGLIRTTSGEEFYIHEGDQLGNKEGRITAIFGSGLEVEEANEITILSVKNRSVSFEKEDS